MKRNHFIASLIAIPAIPAIAVAVCKDDDWIKSNPALLHGCTYEKITITPAQHMDKLKIRMTEIVRVYNLPVHIINTMVV